MDNRFGFRDIILASLLLVLIVIVLLAMKQYDRQWKRLDKIETALTRQQEAILQLDRRLAEGVTVSQTQAGSAATGNIPADAPFPERLKARQMEGFTEGGRLVEAFGSTVGKLTPLVSQDVYGSTVQNYVLETLATRDAQTLKWKPQIARSWEISDDGLTITFEMNPAAKFADGSPVTSEDVVFSYEWLMNPKIDAPRLRPYYESITSVTALGPHTVVFTMRDPYFLGFNVCAGMEILSKKFYSQFTPEQFNESPGLLYGSGPYQLDVAPADWKPGKGSIELVRNANYWSTPPAIDRLTWREITDDTARLVDFRNGTTDTFGPSPEQYVTVRDDPDLLKLADLYEYETITSGYRYIGWNQQRNNQPTLFADKRVRQALTLLLDREDMAEGLMVGLATVANGPFHPLSGQADPDITAWPYDTAKAKALLKDAGWADRDGDGVIENAQGTPFRFKLIYPASSANYKRMAFYLKDAYARAGIVLEPDPLEWTIMIQRMNSRDFDAITLGWGGSVESDPKQIFHSQSIEGGGDNYVNYVNKELDALIDEARMTVDADKRTDLWHQVHRILHEDQPYTFLFNRRSVAFVNKRIQNVYPTRLGLSPRMEWFIPAGKQRN